MHRLAYNVKQFFKRRRYDSTFQASLDFKILRKLYERSEKAILHSRKNTPVEVTIPTLMLEDNQQIYRFTLEGNTFVSCKPR